MDRRQAGVAGPHRVVPPELQVLEERPHHLGVQILELQTGRGLAGVVLHETQQEPEGVPIGGHGVRAGAVLGDEALVEEALKDRSERAHGRAPALAPSRRATTNASSSGVADRYQ